jgi:hypothetical protein
MQIANTPETGENINSATIGGEPQAAAFDIETLKAKPVAPATAPVGNDGLLALITGARKDPKEVAALVTAKKEIVTISIEKKPAKGRYVRVRDGDGWDFSDQVFTMMQPEFQGTRKDYLLVHPSLEEFVNSKRQLRDAVRHFGLAFVVDIYGQPSYWAINLDDSSEWGASAREIAGKLKTEWGAVYPDHGRNVLEQPEGDLGEPSWPEGSPNEWLMKAFKDRIITSEDHPEFNKLLGKTC